MKKLIAAILMLTYFTATAGVTVCSHYCMGKLKECSVWQPQAKKKSCATCGMHKRKGCCEDRQQQVQTEKQYNLPQTGFAFFKLLTLSKPAPYFIPAALLSSTKIVTLSKGAAPPGRSLLPLFIKNCVYRI